MPNRMNKIDELIKNQVSLELRELFPDLITSVTKVDVSKDLSYAKIWVSAIKDVEKVLKDIQREAPLIRRNISQKVSLKKVPQLNFLVDNTALEAEKIDNLIKKIKC